MTENRWRKVFLLTATLLEPADRLLLLMKQNIDKLLANETRLQEYLVWEREKSNSVQADKKIASIRQFYYSLYLLPHFSVFIDLLLNFNFDVSLDLHNDLDLHHDLKHNHNLDLDLSNTIQNCVDRKLKEILEKLQQQLPNSKEDQEIKKQWWKNNGAAWKHELREAMIKYRNIGHEWNFNKQQFYLLNQYLTANKFLMKCLNSECYISREVREEIEDTLFLPFADFNYD